MAISDHILNIVMASGAILAVVISLILFWLQRKKKQLTYKVNSDIDLLTKNEQLEGQVKVLFEEKPVDNIHLYIVQIVNSGNLPIEKGDFDTPLIIEFNDNVQILGAEIIDTDPEEIDAEIERNLHHVVIAPLLMNKRDSMTIKLIVDGNYVPRIYSRIKGVPRVTLRRYPKAYVHVWTKFCLIVTGLLGLLFIALKSKGLESASTYGLHG